MLLSELKTDPEKRKLRRQKTTRNVTQVISEEELHPVYNEKEDGEFVRELYRLKGFAYLRNQ